MKHYDFVGTDEMTELRDELSREDGIIRYIYGLENIYTHKEGEGWDAVSYMFLNGKIIFGSSRNIRPPGGLSAFVLKDYGSLFEWKEVMGSIASMMEAYKSQGSDVDQLLCDMALIDLARKHAECEWFFRKYRGQLDMAVAAAR